MIFRVKKLPEKERGEGSLNDPAATPSGYCVELARSLHRIPSRERRSTQAKCLEYELATFILTGRSGADAGHYFAWTSYVFFFVCDIALFMNRIFSLLLDVVCRQKSWIFDNDLGSRDDKQSEVQRYATPSLRPRSKKLHLWLDVPKMTSLINISRPREPPIFSNLYRN